MVTVTDTVTIVDTVKVTVMDTVTVTVSVTVSVSVTVTVAVTVAVTVTDTVTGAVKVTVFVSIAHADDVGFNQSGRWGRGGMDGTPSVCRSAWDGMRYIQYTANNQCSERRQAGSN